MTAAAATWKAAALAAVMLGAVCAQDGPETAIVIGGLPFSTTGDSTGFTNTVTLGGGPDVFYSFATASEEQNVSVSIDTCGSSYDTEIGVYTLEGGDLVLQASNDDSTFCTGGFTQSLITFAFEAGVEYFVVVDGFDSGEFGDFNLNIDILPSPPPPPSPSPPNPPFPPGTGICALEGACAGDASVCSCSPLCVNNGDCCPDVAASCGFTCAGSCGGSSAFGCFCDTACTSLNDCCPDYIEQCLAPPLPPSPPSPPSPPLPPAPAGDVSGTAIVIEALPFSTSGDSTGFTSTVPLGGGPDVFFTFTSATESIPVSIDTCGSSYDTEIGVYTVEGGNLVLQANNDDDSSFCTGGFTQSRVIFTFEAGVEYFVVVDGFDSGEFGSFNLNIDVLPSPSPPPSPPPPLSPPPFIFADANLDQTVNVIDTVLLVNIVLEFEEAPVGPAFTAADVDSNEVIDISDVIIVLDVAANFNQGEESL